MSTSDSEAVFKARFLEVGLTSDNYEAFKAEGIDSLGTLAFCCNYSPGQPDERPLSQFVASVLGKQPTTREMALVRRLHSEAYSTIAAEIRSKVEASDETAVKKLAPAERTQRLKDQQARLQGLDLRGNHEPGDSLVDRCVACYEGNRLTYIPWEACVSRDHEVITGTKKDAGLSFDASGVLKLSKSEAVEPMSTASDMQVRYCLVRRGLAMEQANIISYANHDRLTEKLMSARMEEPQPGYQKLTMKQIETADKKFWTLMAEATREGVKALAAGRPCDMAFKECITSPEFLTLLQPRVSSQSSSNQTSNHRNTSSQGPRAKKARKENHAFQSAKGKGKSFQRVPTDLLALGCVACDEQGARFCFDYSLKKCKLTCVGGRCPKGAHRCAVKGCGKNHAALDCPMKRKQQGE